MACLLDELRQANPELQTTTAPSASAMRPSFLNGFGAVIDMAGNTPETFLRDLVVRNLPVVVVNREPKTYSTHAVLVDSALGAARIGRHLLIDGHRRLAAVEPPGSTTISHALRQVARRHDGATLVETCSPSDMEHGRGISGLVESGVTAVVCDCVQTAHWVKRGLDRLGVNVPHHVSLAAVGCLCRGMGESPCSGYFADCVPLAQAVVSLLRDNNPTRPTTLWLAGEFVDKGTVGPAVVPSGQPQSPAAVFRFGDAVA